MAEQNFNPETQARIEQLSREIAEKRAELERAGVSEREYVKQNLQPVMYPVQSAPAAMPIMPMPARPSPAASYLDTLPPETVAKTKELVNVALTEGIEKAVQSAEKDSPFMIDVLHDALTDKLYSEIKNRKLI